MALMLAFFSVSDATASNLYFEDGTTNDLNSRIMDGGAGHSSCSGCHLNFTAGAVSDNCTGTAVQTPWLGGISGVATTAQRYAGAGGCASTIADKMTVSPSFGNQMPDGCVTCVPGGDQTAWSTWISNGRPLSAPVANVDSVDNSQKTTASIQFDVNTNTSFSQGSYVVEYSESPSTSYNLNAISVTGRNSTTQLSNTTATLGDNSPAEDVPLSCGTTYNYRVRASNGAANDDDIGSFTTAACTAPSISIFSGTNPVIMSEDSNPQPFSLVLQVSNDDPGTHTWSISSVASNGSASASGTGATKSISYTPNANYVGSDAFTVRATNNSSANNAFVDYVVNVTVNAVDDPPTIDEGDGPIAVGMSEDSTPTPFSLTLNATDLDTAAGSMTWTISSAAANGSASVAGDGTGFSEAIAYVPDADFNGNDSFTVQVTDGGTPDTIVVDVTVNPRNDAPVIPAIGPQTGTEGSLVTITPGDPDIDDTNGSVALTWAFVSTPPAGMTIDANSGEITWTPPLGPPAVFDQIYNITISVDDGGEHHGLSSPHDTDSFTLEIDPPDVDNDLVADYDDFCPGPPNQPAIDSGDGSNADNDNDGTPGSDANPNDNVGGDVCDADDDNDGMPDDFEIASSLNPFDSSDAALDADGDGISNLQEFLDGTNPNLGNLVIDATGYLTPYKLTPPEPSTIHTLATAVTANDNGPYRPGDNTITWTPSNGTVPDLAASDPGNLITNPPTQSFDIRPLASVAPDQLVEENSAATVTVTVRLNGDAPSWTDTPTPNPATVNYTVSGTANNPADHNAADGVLTFNVGDYAEDITFNVLNDATGDADETIVINLTGASNAAIGSRNTHTVTIVEGNLAPRADLQFSQGGVVVGSTFAGDGAITIDALPEDGNSAQALSCDWSGTDNALLPPAIVADCKASPNWTVATPVAGNYRVAVVVNDNGSPQKSTRVSRVLNIAAGASGRTPAELEDADGDGIPAYLDAIDGTVAGANMVPDQTVDVAESMMLETESGLTLRRGSTAQAAEQFGALLTDSDISQHGSRSGNAPLNAEDNFEHIGGIYDFSIHGLMPGGSARIVIPLQSAVPRDGVYRIFHPGTGWSDFVVDDNNRIASTSGEPGACPEPGSSAYLSGLLYLNNCVQLTIQDGGPNDTDNEVNGIINDPSGVGLKLTDPEIEEVKDGSGRVSPLLLAFMLMLGGFAYWRRQGRVRID